MPDSDSRRLFLATRTARVSKANIQLAGPHAQTVVLHGGLLLHSCETGGGRRSERRRFYSGSMEGETEAIAEGLKKLQPG
jgi:hypothetical protein